MAEDEKPQIDKVPVEIKYTDVFDIQIPENTELGSKTREFLEFFQQAEFEYQQMNPETKEITTRTLSGQDILRNIQSHATTFGDAGLLKDGKFPIDSDPREFDGTILTGARTKFAGIKTSAGMVEIGLGITLSDDYLRRAEYTGVDGKAHPVTLDGVLTNELAHLSGQTSNENYSIGLENIVMVQLGAEQRAPGEGLAKVNDKPAETIQTLYNKAELVNKKEANKEVKPEPQKEASISEENSREEVVASSSPTALPIPNSSTQQSLA